MVLLLQEEIKQCLVEKQNRVEAEVLTQLAEELPNASVAGTIYRKWGLDGQLIKDCHVDMESDRPLQVTFYTLVGGTRF